MRNYLLIVGGGIFGFVIGVTIMNAFMVAHTSSQSPFKPSASWRTDVEMRLLTQDSRLSTECPQKNKDCVAAFYIRDAKANAVAMGIFLDIKP